VVFPVQDASNPVLNIGIFQLMNLSGQVFSDTNGNGVKDAFGEPGLGDWIVFLDNNNDGLPNDGPGTSVTTSDGGHYSFANLGPAPGGVYRVKEVPVNRWMQTTPTVSFPVLTGQNVPDQDFGNFQLFSISGTAFHDLNGDGIRQAGEPGLQGWVITLDKGA